MLIRLVLYLVALGAAFLTSLSALILVGIQALHQPLALSRATTYEVPAGSSLQTLVDEMTQEHILQQGWALVAWARFQGQATQIKAGEYQLEVGLTPYQLLAKLIEGSQINHQVTFPEGWNFNQLRQELRKHTRLQQKLSQLEDAQVMAALGVPEVHPEGRFFPDTYYYHKGMSDLQVLQQAYTRMQKILAQEWAQEQKIYPMPQHKRL